MIVTITPAKLSGTAALPPSKSELHRLLIAAALSERPTRILCGETLCEDISATVRCLSALGAWITSDRSGLTVAPIVLANSGALLDCGESASTLRFLLPVAAALGVETNFTGGGSLPGRPLSGITALLREHGCRLSADVLPLTIGGKLQGGDFSVEGSLTSQYATGLLLALPIMDGGCLALPGGAVSGGYLALTARVLRRFGIAVADTDNQYIISGRYRSPGSVPAEPDMSAAAVWRAMDALGCNVSCGALPESSSQPDAHLPELLEALRGGGTVDCSGYPDLLPVLAAVASATPGCRARIFGGERLRAKESDRLSGTAELLSALGAEIEVRDGGLDISGKRLRGGGVSCRGDHRLAMAAAVAACACATTVTIAGAEAVAKSYPRFWLEYAKLGGLLDVVHDR